MKPLRRYDWTYDGPMPDPKGNYCDWEEVEEVIKKLLKEIETLRAQVREASG
jgi:hypothetical protein